MPRNPRMILAALAVAACGSAPVFAQNAQPVPGLTVDAEAKAIFDRHGRAVGGPAKKFKYDHRVVEMRMVEGVISRIESFTMRPDKVLIVTAMPGLGITETGYDGKIGWSTSPITGPVLLNGEPLNRLKASIGVVPSQGVQDGAKLLSLGRAAIDGRAVNAILSVSANGDTNTVYFDVESGLMSALRPRSHNGQPVDTTPLMLFSDYKRIDGGLMSMTMTVRTRSREVVSRTIQFDHDPIDSARFVPPAAVLSLLPRVTR